MDFSDLDGAFDAYAKAHRQGGKRPVMLMKQEPKLSDYYTPSEAQKEGELLFVGGSALGLGYAASRWLL